jgi:hypothetical protein
MTVRGGGLERSGELRTMSDGFGVYCRRWTPKGGREATLCIIHGVGEHCGRMTRSPSNGRPPATPPSGSTFPVGVHGTAFEEKAGWGIEPKRDVAGAIVGVTWTGKLPPDQFTEFGVMAIDPKSAAVLT